MLNAALQSVGYVCAAEERMRMGPSALHRVAIIITRDRGQERARTRNSTSDEAECQASDTGFLSGARLQ